MTTPSESENRSANVSAPVPSSFIQHPNPGGIPVADRKFHKPLFSLAKMMMKKGHKAPSKSSKGIKTNQTVHISHTKKKVIWY